MPPKESEADIGSAVSGVLKSRSKHRAIVLKKNSVPYELKIAGGMDRDPNMARTLAEQGKLTPKQQQKVLDIRRDGPFGQPGALAPVAPPGPLTGKRITDLDVGAGKSAGSSEGGRYHKALSYQKGICAGISSSWVVRFLAGILEARDEPGGKFKRYFETLRNEGSFAHARGLELDTELSRAAKGADDGGRLGRNRIKCEMRKSVVMSLAGKFSIGITCFRTYVDIRDFNVAVFPGGSLIRPWAALVGFPEHVVGCGAYAGKYYIMDPNNGLFVYDSLNAVTSTLNEFQDIRVKKCTGRLEAGGKATQQQIDDLKSCYLLAFQGAKALPTFPASSPAVKQNQQQPASRTAARGTTPTSAA